jgi:hypothetical protein
MILKKNIFFQSKDCFQGLLGEVIFPTFSQPPLPHLVHELLIVPPIQSEQVSHQLDWWQQKKPARCKLI